MKKSYGISILISRLISLFFILSVFSTCFSDWKDETSLSISLIGNARTLTGFNNTVNLADLEWNIKLINNQTGQVKYAIINSAGTHASVTDIETGNWDIIIDVSIFGGYSYAFGEVKSFKVNHGKNSTSVKMERFPDAIALDIANDTTHTFIQNDSGRFNPLELRIFNFSNNNSMTHLDVGVEFRDYSGGAGKFHHTADSPIQPSLIKQDDFFLVTVTVNQTLFNQTLADNIYSDAIIISFKGETIATIELEAIQNGNKYIVLSGWYVTDTEFGNPLPERDRIILHKTVVGEENNIYIYFNETFEAIGKNFEKIMLDFTLSRSLEIIWLGSYGEADNSHTVWGSMESAGILNKGPIINDLSSFIHEWWNPDNEPSLNKSRLYGLTLRINDPIGETLFILNEIVLINAEE